MNPRKTSFFFSLLIFALLFIIFIPSRTSSGESVEFKKNENSETATVVTSKSSVSEPSASIVKKSSAPKKVPKKNPNISRVAEPSVISEKATPYSYRLSILKLGIDAGVVIIGKTSEGKMAVPDNFTEVGLFGYGAMPGGTGNTVMGAHVDNGGQIAGVFKNLKDLSVGDDIYVTSKDGTKFHYKVTGAMVHDRNSSVPEVFSQNSGMHRLNLITCYGIFLPQENTYTSRLIVTSELVAN